MSDQQLMDFFYPQSIAIVGASTDFTAIGGKPLNNLIRRNYKGGIYPVNPKYEEIGGYRCYPSLLDLPETPDVVMVAISKSWTMNILAQCVEKKIDKVILFGSGFAEADEEGQRLQEEVLAYIREHRIRVIGPNCLGCLNVKEQLPMGFATSLETEKDWIQGPVALVSQSGAFGFSVFGMAQEEHVGFTYVANTGNQIDVHTLDLMREFIEDADTTVVAGYLESIPDGEMLLELTRRAKQTMKPLIMLKAGRSEVGQKSALSHTASVTGSAAVYDAIVKQYGIVQVQDMDDMIDAMKVFARRKFPRGSRVAVISSSGAAGITIADYCEDLGLEMVALSEETKRKIAAVLPSFGSAENPIDVTAQALVNTSLIKDTFEILIEDEQVDTIVFQTAFKSELVTGIFEDIERIDQQTDKPIIVIHTGMEEIVGDARTRLQQTGMPVYPTCYRAILAISHLTRFAQFCRQPDPLQHQYAASTAVPPSTERVWTEVTVKQLLPSLQIRVPEGVLIQDADEVKSAMKHMPYPVVAKIVSPDILHKTDAGGVTVGIRDEASLAEAIRQMQKAAAQYQPDARIDGIWVEQMIQENGVEMFIGVMDDPQFGPMIVCGIGGIFIEALKDRVIRHAPVDLRQAREMIAELKGYPLLTGIRGKKPMDADAFATALVHVSNFAYENRGRIAEMDLNPVVVLEEGRGVIALDGLMIWK